MKNKGFTLIELILVIAILGILAISALPRFLDLSTEAEQASRDGVVGAVRAGIQLYRANDMVTNGGVGNYPATLDGESNGACANCFDTILTNGVSDGSWTRVSDTAYEFDDGTNPPVTFSYDQSTGEFQ
ncbi:MAG: hypothetical protein A3I05_05480 [Deltaproteobacteria bacterium RIFCSPLOWO2_02_FULL_44_10]|nr:MAG: hypothetical protein A3C46_06230 [Deltaproteobacteria bacterium RIFCSPHIGHO2_02_FULL_44_16]OGQ46035.1 MAG: hypothetical protein A3I05_05480 [Deltaproteobacteria bacterium RIFCSPLOWO2_02_FULL_44_10]